MAEENPLPVGTDDKGGHGKFLLLQRHDLGSYDPRHVDPAVDTDAQHHTVDIRAEDQHQQNHVDHGRHSVDHINDAHHDHVRPSPRIARDAAIEHPDHEVQRRGGKAHHQADPCPVQDPGEDVPAHLVGTEEMGN